jgi:AbrB family looped-hinge helix DNA binding protein
MERKGRKVKNFDMKRVDEKGRVVITKTLRDMCGFKEGECVALYEEEGRLVVEPFKNYMNRKGEK